MPLDIQAVKKKSKDYFFMAKNKAQEIKRQAFQGLYDIVKQEIMPTVQQCVELTSQQAQQLPWNIRRTVQQIRHHAQKYLSDVARFIQCHTI